jgi:hypothetical protein
VAPEVAVTYNLIELGNRPASPAELPHHLIFDRVYVNGTPHVNLRRGIALNRAWTAIIDSAIADVHEVGADSQAIAGWDGPGPYKIVNNDLEGAGENVMFGGADPSIRDLVPSDIEIRRNRSFKPLAWRIGDPGYAGRPWTVKNLLELKNARRVLIDGNLFEHNWAHAQAGTAIVFTVRNQDGTAPWSVVEDVTFTNNVVRHTGAGVGMHGIDGKPSQPTKRILIKNNLFDDVSGARWGGGGRLFQAYNGITDLVIEHNTAFQDGPIIWQRARRTPASSTATISRPITSTASRAPEPHRVATRSASISPGPSSRGTSWSGIRMRRSTRRATSILQRLAQWASWTWPAATTAWALLAGSRAPAATARISAWTTMR